MRLALFISGEGTTAEAIIKAYKTGRLNIEPTLVIASRRNIGGIERVKRAGIPEEDVIVRNPRSFKNTNEFALALISPCVQRGIDVIWQCGWKVKTPEELIAWIRGNIFNQHPGPLNPPEPDFGGDGMYGRSVHEAVLYFRRVTNHDLWTEATTHEVNAEYDKGRVIGRKALDILDTDTSETLQQRLLPIEHELQIEVIDAFVNGSVKTLVRESPLIQHHEIPILKNAKQVGRLAYPHG